jgi:hypothetical protein
MGLVNWMAPQSRADLLRKALIFLALINLLNWVATAVRGVPYALGADLGNTTAVALPLRAVHPGRAAPPARAPGAARGDGEHRPADGPAQPARLHEPRAAGHRGRAGRGRCCCWTPTTSSASTTPSATPQGDACLAAIAARLRAQLRPGDLVGRLGGEEFAVFLPGATREDAAETGARLCAAISVEAAAAEERLAVTLPAGAALGDGVTPLDRLMADADRALYVAKARGRGRVVVWPPGEAPDAEAA